MVSNTMCKSYQIVIEYKMKRMDDIRERIHGNHEEKVNILKDICSINGLADFFQTIVI